MIEDIKLITTTKAGTRIKSAATVEYADGRIRFLKSPFSLKDEIKAMQGAKWHGFDPVNPEKIWSVKDTQRNRFQLEYMKGGNPYEWFDREIVKHEYERPLMSHQKEIADFVLTYHYSIVAGEPGVGKTLAAISVMEKSGVRDWWFVAPRSVLKAIEREFKKWNLDPSINVELLTYEGLTSRMEAFEGEPPQGIIFDESSKLKTATSKRSVAALKIANLIRNKYDNDGFVILMSGTPAPQNGVDWWSSSEIAYPGFLREGSPQALERRLAFFKTQEFDSGPIAKRSSWRDDENKCDTCGEYKEAHTEFTDHDFKPSINEVRLLYERLQGLVIVKRKKDCLDLPEKHYRRIYCTPGESTLRVAKALVSTSINAITGLTLLRELSDGFQYREVANGTKPCGHCNATGVVREWFDADEPDRVFSQIDMLDAETVAGLSEHEVECPGCNGKKEVPTTTRIAKEIPCPKENILRELLEEVEEQGRLVVFAGFTGSIDRCVRICQEEGWSVVRCDGRGFSVLKTDFEGNVTELVGVDALDYWENRENERVAFVAHPESGGFGLTLTQSSMAVFYSNSYRSETRVQAEDRVHRVGADWNRGVTIVDILHLPTDETALDALREKRRLELLSMSEIDEALKETVVERSR